MTAMAIGARMSADEYLALGETWPRTELIEGEVVLSAPKLLHQVVCGELELALRLWVGSHLEHGLVVRPLDVKLDADVIMDDKLLPALLAAPGPAALAVDVRDGLGD